MWLVGTVGDSAAGLAQLQLDKRAAGPLVDTYRRPVPLLADGQALAQHAKAMMDVSDGLLLDALRLAEASVCAAEIALDELPLSNAFVTERGEGHGSRVFAATGGDDYALLAALPADLDPSTLSLPGGASITRVGSLGAGQPQLRLTSGGRPIELPETLGHEHRSSSAPPMAGRD
ncbi:MAG TPA: AIR synthase-related protein [Sphingomicrobium sp.]|nr:AIR synthase-related protein [Sphingomicrobium sp.]